jgi:hypothetical protein
LDTSEGRSEIAGKFRNVVLEKNGEDQMNRSVRIEEVLRRVKQERNILHTVERRKANWIGPILHRNCLLKHVIEGKIEMTGRRRKQLLNDLREKRGHGKFKEAALDRTVWRTRLGRGYYEPVVRQTTE